MDPDSPGRRRHVWVDASGGGQHPGLVIAWRKTADRSGWEAYVAVARSGSVLTTRVPSAMLHPVTDDRWQLRP